MLLRKLVVLLLMFYAKQINCSFYGFDNDKADWDIFNQQKQWNPIITSGPTILISSNITSVYDQNGDPVEFQLSNNNVGIAMHEDRIFMGFRTAPTHFAGADTQMYIVSTTTDSFPENWVVETMVYREKDLREPYLLVQNGTLYFYFFELGTNPISFDPNKLLRMSRTGFGDWTDPEEWGHKGECTWQFNTFNNTAYSLSFSGTEGVTSFGNVNLFLNQSNDGITWKPISDDKPIVYEKGGISEVGWAFDLFGDIWGVGRNEDGDSTGWGSRTFRTFDGVLSDFQWISGNQSNPQIYESPRMFRHGNDLYLIGRTDPNGQFWSKDNTILNILPESIHHLIDLGRYSLRSHGTAIWKLNQEKNGELEWVLDLPGCGDTAFPGFIRTGANTYIIVNYSSPWDICDDWSWIRGQISKEGTLIYMVEIEFIEV